MKTRRNLVLLIAFSLISSTGITLAQQEANASIPFQGRLDLTAGGSYSGTAWFKFRIIGGEGDGLWGNDGSPGTNAPATSVTNFVSGGLFNVRLGGYTMSLLPPIALHDQNPQLRTWVSTNNIDFELLGEDIQLDPVSFRTVDTGGTIIVDDDGNGDFTTIQDAIDHIALNAFDFSGLILVMPGFYNLDTPLSFPSGTSINLRGVGTHADAMISNTNGAAAIKNGWSTILENLTISGSPAISDVHSVSNYYLLVKQCTLQGIDGPGDAVMEISSSNEGNVTLWHSEVTSQTTDPCGSVRLTGNVQFSATHTEFNVWQNDSDVFALSNYLASCSMESCFLNPSGGSAFNATDIIGGQDFRFRNVVFQGPVRIDNRISSSNAGFVSCDFITTSNSALYARNNLSSLKLGQCRIQTQSGHGIEVLVTEDAAGSAFINIVGTSIDVFSGGSHDGLSLSGASTNEFGGLNVSVRQSTIHSFQARDGIHFLGSEGGNNQIDLAGCDVSSERYGLWIANASAALHSTSIAGQTNGVFALGGEIEIAGGSNVSGGDNETGTGGGLYVSNCFVGISLSEVLSEGGAAMKGHSSTYIATGAGFEAEAGGAAVHLIDANGPTYFNRCNFLSFDTNASAEAVIILDAAITNAPTPELFGCTIRGLGTQDTIGVGAGASSASVRMLNTTLSAAVSTNITLLGPTVVLSNGNAIVSTPASWLQLVEEE